MATLDSKIPSGPLADKWRKHKTEIELVNPANKRKYEVIVVGAGLAGASAASTLADLRLQGEVLRVPRQPRRAHSIAAQGGINAAKTTRMTAIAWSAVLRHPEGWRLPRPRSQRPSPGRGHPSTSSTNASRRASASPVNTAASSPTAPSAVPKFPARSTPAGQTGQQLLLGAYSALSRTVGAGAVELHVDSRCSISSSSAARPRASSSAISSRRDLAATPPTPSSSPPGGYGNVFNLSTYARGSNATAIWRAYKRGACIGQPVLHADPVRPAFP